MKRLVNPSRPKVHGAHGIQNLEETSIDHVAFDEQFKNFQRSGYAVDVSTNEVFGDVSAYNRESVQTAWGAASRGTGKQGGGMGEGEEHARKKKKTSKEERALAMLQMYTEQLEEEEEEQLSGGNGALVADDYGIAGPWASFKEDPTVASNIAAAKLHDIEQKALKEMDKDRNYATTATAAAAAAAAVDASSSGISSGKGKGGKSAGVGDLAGDGDQGRETEKEIDAEGEGEGEERKAGQGIHLVEPDEEDEKWEKVNERKISNTLPPRPKRGSQIAEATSIFHGQQERDYQGRSWAAAPPGVRGDGGEHDCFIPKKCIRKFTGHTKGVQAIEIFPETGHLFLSGGMDGKCKIWSLKPGDFNVKRTYLGHSEAVRSIQFNKIGSHFLSSGFDRNIRLWDVETGQATGTFSNRKMAYSVRFYPLDQNIFIAACSDNKLYQWDARSGEVVQEYNHHLQPANTVTFVDDGRKFVSTSDDKKMLVWEFDIPVPIKYIAEPDMQSIPAITVHPSGQYMAGQSMDNKIVVYSCGEKVKEMKKKVFTGHNNSGYACQIGFSPNGQFLVSGDGLGMLHCWDWKSSKSYRKFQAHEKGPCMGAQWHPLQPSWLLTCGWDGLIKLWD